MPPGLELQRCCCSNSKQKKKWKEGVSLLGSIQTSCQELPSGFFRWGSSVCLPIGQQFTMLLGAPEKDREGYYSSPLASIPRQQSINPVLPSPLLQSASIGTSICLPVHILWQNRGRNSATHFLSFSLSPPLIPF